MAQAQILSVVTVIQKPDRAACAAITAAHAAVRRIGTVFEFVVVTPPAIGGGAGPELRELLNELPDLQIYVLQGRVDRLSALLAGVENAVGDWVATLDLHADPVEAVERLYAKVLDEGTEVGLGLDARRGAYRNFGESILAGCFHAAFRALHGFDLNYEAPTLRILSRAVVNVILSHEYPQVAFETATATSGYRKSVLQLEGGAPQPRPIRERIAARWRVLIGMNAVPLRLANAVCVLGALVALAYSAYVVVVYLVKDNVAPGWTTVSLVLSAMFFMLSVVLWLLSEYMVMLLDVANRRPRYQIVEELFSPVQTRRQQLNVESEH